VNNGILPKISQATKVKRLLKVIHQAEAPEPGAESDVYDSVALRTVYVNFPITVYLIKLSSEPLDHRQMSYSRNVSLRCKEVWIKK